MRKISLSNAESRRIRIIALVSSTVGHFLLFSLLFLLQRHTPGLVPFMQLDWRSGGGGGGGGLKVYEIEFGPQSGNQTQSTEDIYRNEKFTVTHIKVESFANQGVPVIHEEKPKKIKKKKVIERLYGENLPTKHRRGYGPGSGGGTGGGAGGGIGKSFGSSIDWGGSGSRRLLSGRLPKYPEGTTKEMSVYLQFTVLPDGSVSNVIPLQKSDELLEREAITALRTWRFEPLPEQFDQKSQTGKITFSFKLE